jgi:hypothetical protein
VVCGYVAAGVVCGYVAAGVVCGYVAAGVVCGYVTITAGSDWFRVLSIEVACVQARWYMHNRTRGHPLLAVECCCARTIGSMRACW